MEKLLWIGSPFFAPSLKDVGWQQVHVHNFETPDTFSWPELVKLAGFEPDVLVVADKSRPPFVLGMEDFPCLTVFYSVDSHIHAWQPHYAQGFDACLVSLYDNMQEFAGPFLAKEHVWWSPPFAQMEDIPNPGQEKVWDSLFVGSINSALLPKRSRFLTDLGAQIPSLITMTGSYRLLFPKAKVLINHAEHDDLNFRVFEAMGMGGCLVTPRIAHGLPNLFVDGEQLVFYAPNDAGDAAYRIKFLLDHPDVLEHISREAAAAIDKNHRAIHRAQTFTDHICDLFMEGADAIIAARRANASQIREACLKMPYLLWANEQIPPNLKAAYLGAANGDFRQRAGN